MIVLIYQRLFLFFIFLFISVFSGLSSFAFPCQQKIVLMTSVVAEKSPIRSFFCSHSYLSKLEDKFRQQFKHTNYEVQVTHGADQYHLWKELHDPRNVAVFWLSHSGVAITGGKEGQASGVMGFQKVSDIEGYDLAPVFQKIHPNLRFLAMIGCDSQSVIDRLEIGKSDLLRVIGFHGKIDAKKGLKQAMFEAKSVLSSPDVLAGYPPVCSRVPGYRVRAHRLFSEPSSYFTEPDQKTVFLPHRSARVMADGQIVAVFPKPRPQEMNQVIEFFLPAKKLGDSFTVPGLRIDLGENAGLMMKPGISLHIDIGLMNAFVVRESDPSSFFQPWYVWASRGTARDPKKEGTPIGIFSNSYFVNPEVRAEPDALKDHLVSESEFDCNCSMPRY